MANENAARRAQQENTTAAKELATAKAEVKKLREELRLARGQAEVKVQAPVPKHKDVVLASNKALRTAVDLLKRVKDQVAVVTSGEHLVGVVVKHSNGEVARQLFEKDIPEFLAMDHDSKVSVVVKPAVVVSKALTEGVLTRGDTTMVMAPTGPLLVATPATPKDAPQEVK
jgi:hypothetical protein